MYNNNNDIRKGSRAKPSRMISFRLPFLQFSFLPSSSSSSPFTHASVSTVHAAVCSLDGVCGFSVLCARRYVHIISAACLFVVACSIINLNNVNIHGTYRAAEWQWEHKQIQTRRGARGTNWQTLCYQMNHCILYERNLTKIDWSILFTIHHE